MKITFGTRASAMLSGIVLATAFVAGCTEEAATEKPAASPATPPAAASLGRSLAGDTVEAAGSPAERPATLRACKGRREEVITKQPTQQHRCRCGETLAELFGHGRIPDLGGCGHFFGGDSIAPLFGFG